MTAQPVEDTQMMELHYDEYSDVNLLTESGDDHERRFSAPTIKLPSRDSYTKSKQFILTNIVESESQKQVLSAQYTQRDLDKIDIFSVNSIADNDANHILSFHATPSTKARKSRHLNKTTVLDNDSQVMRINNRKITKKKKRKAFVLKSLESPSSTTVSHQMKAMGNDTSERRIAIGAKIQVKFLHIEEWMNATVGRIYQQPNNYNDIRVEFKCDKNGEYQNANEWSGWIDVINEATDNDDWDYYERDIMGCNGTIDGCQYTERLIHALKIYQQFDLNEGIFMEYLEVEYLQLMNDWAHFMSKHNDMIELEQLFEDITQKYQLQPCNLKNCVFAIRHHRDRSRTFAEHQNINSENPQDYENLFYQDLMDGIHCFMYHLYDFGLRRRESSFANVLPQGNGKSSDIKSIANRYTINKFDILSQSNPQGIASYFTICDITT